MDSAVEKPVRGKISSLHVHPEQPGTSMRAASSLNLVASMGIKEEARYFDRRNRTTGQPTVRQVSLIERERIDQHARALGLKDIVPGAVRANVETVGIDWVPLVGKKVRVGEAVLLICEPRKPCAKMDAICPGLRALMEPNRQGVLAQVVQSGRITQGDSILLIEDSPAT